MADGFDLGGRLRVDFSELEEIPDRTEAAVAAADGQQIQITTEVDDGQATRSFRETDLAIARLDKAVARPKIEVDGSQADRTIADLRAQFAALDTRLSSLRAEAAGAGLGGTGKVKAVGGEAVAAAGGAAGLARTAPLAAAAALPLAIMGARQVYGATVPISQQNAKVRGALTRNFGAETGHEFIAASKALSDATGFLANDFREAALAGKTLAAMSEDPAKASQLQAEAIKKLLPVAADIAATSPDKQLQSVAGAFNTMKLAIAGSASAQERLGIDLSDAHMQTQAFGGALKNTWADLSAAEQAQLRYKDMLAQTSDIMGEAEDETGLEFQTRQLNKTFDDLKVAVGDRLQKPLAEFIGLINALVDAIPHWVPEVLGKAVEYGYKAEKVGMMVSPVTYAPGSLLNLHAADAKERSDALARAGFDTRATVGFHPRITTPEGVTSSATVPTTVQVSLNVRREPGTTINLDSASYAPSNV